MAASRKIEREEDIISKKEENHTLILFSDGKSPAIKKITKIKRRELTKKRHQNHDNRDNDKNGRANLALLCEKFVMKLSPLVNNALMDILRIPLMKTLRTNDLYTHISSLSEADDDIVRLASVLFDLNTPIKTFSADENKLLYSYNLKPLLNIEKGTTSLVRGGFGKYVTKWSDFAKTVNTDTSVALYSHDSDILVKWNLLAAHHYDVSSALGLSKPKNEFLKDLNFFRSRNFTNNNKSVEFNLGDKQQQEQRTKETQNVFLPTVVYDLTNSPVLHSTEKTLLIMLTKGSDYNGAIVSSMTASSFDEQIRDEFAMFENVSCTCIGGWPAFFKEISLRKQCGDSGLAVENSSIEEENISIGNSCSNNKIKKLKRSKRRDCRKREKSNEQQYHQMSFINKQRIGLVGMENVSKVCCSLCNKRLVLPFWALKMYYASSSMKFINNPKILFNIEEEGKMR